MGMAFSGQSSARTQHGRQADWRYAPSHRAFVAEFLAIQPTRPSEVRASGLRLSLGRHFRQQVGSRIAGQSIEGDDGSRTAHENTEYRH